MSGEIQMNSKELDNVLETAITNNDFKAIQHLIKSGANLMNYKLLIGSFLFLPSIAYAHGQDILEPIIFQFGVSLLITICIISSSLKFKNKIRLMVGLILGVIVSWMLLSGVDYASFLKYHILFTTFTTIVPIITTFIAYKSRK